MKLLRNLAAGALCLATLPGCVSYPVIAYYENYNEILYGHAYGSALREGSTFTLKSRVSDMKCDGYGSVDYAAPFTRVGMRGTIHANCNNARVVYGNWVINHETEGSGVGTDDLGNRLAFSFRFSEEDAELAVRKFMEASKDKPKFSANGAMQAGEQSVGTGFFITNNGYLVTNFHVIRGATQVSVYNSVVKKEYPASIEASDPVNDIAVLKIDAETAAIPIASASNDEKGAEVLTLGYPLITLQGKDQKATFGHINALSGTQSDIRFLQIDVPIQPGNSGGPLINNKGQVVGIVSSMLNQLATIKIAGVVPQNVNYAVKAAYIFPVLKAANVPESQLSGVSLSEKQDFSKIVSTFEKSVVMIVAK